MAYESTGHDNLQSEQAMEYQRQLMGVRQPPQPTVSSLSSLLTDLANTMGFISEAVSVLQKTLEPILSTKFETAARNTARQDQIRAAEPPTLEAVQNLIRMAELNYKQLQDLRERVRL